MDRHYSPRTLDHELNLESPDDQKRSVRRKNPQGNQNDSTSGGENDRPPASPMLRQESDDRSTTDRSHGVNNCDLRGLVRTEVALLLQIGRVKILSAMGHVVERRHQERRINEKHTVLSK